MKKKTKFNYFSEQSQSSNAQHSQFSDHEISVCQCRSFISWGTTSVRNHRDG